MTTHTTAGPREVAPWIGGKFHDAREWTEVRDPYRRELAARVAISDAAIVDQAVAVAKATQPAVAALPSYERAAILRRAADIVEQRAEELAATVTRQTGKVISDTLREAKRTPWTFRAAATAAETITGEVHQADAVPLGERLTAMTIRQPVGVVAAVTPFNSPINLVAHKLAPAIAAGNAIVVKPASPAPLTAFDLAAILEEAGLPPGAVNIVPGNAATGATLVAHPDVALITFTGGTSAGESIRRAAGFRRVLLELGGNSPNIVHRDANLSAAVAACVRGGFANGGQSCNSVQRVLVHENIRDRFAEEVLAVTRELKVGDPLDPEVAVGPVVSEESAARVVSWIEQAVATGATVLTGGTRDGALLQPTVVADAGSTCQLYSDEIFAPVILVNSYRDLDEAVEMANSTVYGLQAAIFTSSLDVAFDVARRLRAGGVMVNRSSNFRLDHLPYGGVGNSGMGREGPAIAVEEMTEAKLVVLAPSGEQPR
jgi:acyl-CoA reductase-like NAD-dependent aldehyde dehydrogenase